MRADSSAPRVLVHQSPSGATRQKGVSMLKKETPHHFLQQMKRRVEPKWHHKAYSPEHVQSRINAEGHTLVSVDEDQITDENAALFAKLASFSHTPYPQVSLPFLSTSTYPSEKISTPILVHNHVICSLADNLTILNNSSIADNNFLNSCRPSVLLMCLL